MNNKRGIILLGVLRGVLGAARGLILNDKHSGPGIKLCPHCAMDRLDMRRIQDDIALENNYNTRSILLSMLERASLHRC